MSLQLKMAAVGIAWLAIATSRVAPTALADGDDKKMPQENVIGASKDGTPVKAFTITNAKGAKARVMTYGGILMDLIVPDRDGKMDDIVLGFDNLEGYLAGHPFFGATVGRYANRIGGARFSLDGKEYKLAKNNGENTLHGGMIGFDKVVWQARPFVNPAGSGVVLTHESKDGDEGYPGNLRAEVTYLLTDDNALRIDYKATTDKTTVCNLTNHSYFNLGGVQCQNILDHEVMIAADRYTPSDKGLVPTGELAPVDGTPLDFRKPTKIGSRISDLPSSIGGYDHNFVLNSGGKSLALIATVYEPQSGRFMEMWTTEPGVQLYTSNFMDGKTKGKQGIAYNKHRALCLEAQKFPDSPNKPSFPSATLKPGETYTQTTIYKLSTK